MFERVIDFGNDMLRYSGGLDRSQWMMIFVGVVAVGFFCMRGFGSRKDY